MIQENKHIVDDLERIPIQIPSDAYFEELKKNLLTEIGTHRLKKKGAPGIISMYRRWYVWGSAAAILVFILLFPWNNTGTSSSEPINLSSVSNEEIYDYLNENIEDLDAETIAVHLSTDAIAASEDPGKDKNAFLEENNGSLSSTSPLLEHIEDEEILDYLNNESGELDEYLLIES